LFRDVIRATPLTSVTANAAFGKIVGCDWSGDWSFLGTLRALVYPRLKDEDALSLGFSSSSYNSSTVARCSAEDVLQAMVGSTVDIPNRLTIVSLNCRDSNGNEAQIDLITKKFTEIFKDWVRVEKVTAFFRKKFITLCFVNPKIKSTIVFVDSMSVQTMHYLQCGIFAFLPWYFDPKDGASELEMRLIESLREGTSENYMKCMEEFASLCDLRATAIKTLLQGFENSYERVELEKLENEKADIIYRIDSLTEEIRSYLARERDCDIRILGIETKLSMDTGESELMSYFVANPKLTLENVLNGREMTFYVRDYLEYFKEDEVESVINSLESFIYRPNGNACNNIIPVKEMRALMRTIFLDREFKIKTCAAYTLHISGRIVPLTGYPYGVDCFDRMSNPHIDRFGCIGNYTSTVESCLRQHNYVGAIEQCAASCRTLNFTDSTVLKEFMRRMYGIDGNTVKRCIELPDGATATPKEAIAYMKENGMMKEGDL